MISCAFCGRDNDAASRFCIDCGKPLAPSAARLSAPPASAAAHSPAPIVRSAAASPAARAAVGEAAAAPAIVPPARVTPAASTSASTRLVGAAECPSCRSRIDPALPFCPWCGSRTPAGDGVTGEGRTIVLSPGAGSAGPRLALLDDAGNVIQRYVMDSGELTVGRTAGDVVFADDDYLSPIHAQFSWRGGTLVVRDLGSRNGSWVFLDAPHRLADGDVMLVGSQLVRFRRLGYPGPRLPEADQTRRMGSFTPSADVAVLQQLRADGSTRDVFHLSPGRAVLLGRAEGDWVFPYDKTMSARHAEVRSEDAEFVVLDCGSRNGVGLAVRGDRPLRAGQRVLLGDHTLRVESL